MVTGSNIRGGLGSLFFSDNVTGGGSTLDAPLTITFPVETDDFLPLGEHTIQVSGLDRLANTSKPEDAQLLFKVSQLAISFQPSCDGCQPGSGSCSGGADRAQRRTR